MSTRFKNAFCKASRVRVACVRWLACLVLAAGFVSCDGQPESTASWPAGHWIVGDVAALAPVMGGLEQLAGTPASRFASLWRNGAANCEQFVMHAPEGTGGQALLDNITCGDSLAVPAVVLNRRGDAAAAFSFDLSNGPGTQSAGHLHGRISIAADGSHAIDAAFEPNHTDESGGLAPALQLLVQGDEPAGTAALSGADAVIHARIRPEAGLDLASLVSAGSQADQMFQLKSELFVGALLEGVWELALYVPRNDQVTPPVVLALDHTMRAGAERAMQTFVSELEQTWPIHHTAQEVAGYPGACFHDLKLLPDLVPCYVVTERSIVVGWNPASIEVALGRAADPPTFASGPVLDEQGGWLVHLDRLPHADSRLQRQLGGAGSAQSLANVFDRLRVDARVDGSGGAGPISLLIQLERNPQLGATQ